MIPEQRDAVIQRLIEGAREWRGSLEGDGWDLDGLQHAGRPGMAKIFEAIYELDVSREDSAFASPNSVNDPQGV
jgi:hypothetical protein